MLICDGVQTLYMTTNHHNLHTFTFCTTPKTLFSALALNVANGHKLCTAELSNMSIMLRDTGLFCKDCFRTSVKSTHPLPQWPSFTSKVLQAWWGAPLNMTSSFHEWKASDESCPCWHSGDHYCLVWASV